MTIEGKTWSRGTNSRFPFGVNVNLNLSSINQDFLNCMLTDTKTIVTFLNSNYCFS